MQWDPLEQMPVDQVCGAPLLQALIPVQQCWPVQQNYHKAGRLLRRD